MRVLYVEDNPGDARLLYYELAEKAPSVSIDWVPTYRDAVNQLSLFTAENPGYDLILTDMELPDGKGVLLLSFLRDRGFSIPLVVITGLGDEESAVNALKAGASDYVVKKDDYLSYLPGTLEAVCARYRNETGRHAKPLHILYGEGDAPVADSTAKHLSAHAPYLSLEVVGAASEILERCAERKGGTRGCRAMSCSSTVNSPI